MSSDLTRLAIDPPASPRRSRRASGLAPASELFDTLELRNRTITEVYSPLAKMGRSASEGKATLDSSRRSRARSGAVTSKEKEKVTKEQEGARMEESEDGNMTVVELKEELKSRGLSVAGNKADLRRRLLDSQVESRTKSPIRGSPASTPSKLTLETPTKRENTPKHTLLTPGRKSKKPPTAEEETLPVTPSRRSRRISGSLDLDTGAPATPSRLLDSANFKIYMGFLSRRVRRSSLSETPLTPSATPLTPSRRSRRLSGVEPDLEVAPDGGVIQIQRNTPRKDLKATPTGRARRHTSVKSSDVQEALNLAPVTPALPILVEEEEEIMEAEPASTTPTRRGSKRKARDSEAVIDVDMEEASPSPKKGKKKVRTSEPMEESSKEEEAPRKMSR